MERFQGTKELKEHLSQMDYPKEIQERLLFQIELVERCNKEGATPTYLVIALTPSDMEELEKEYSISSLYPELYEYHRIADGTYWRERVFVFGDSGNGIVCFEKCH